MMHLLTLTPPTELDKVRLSLELEEPRFTRSGKLEKPFTLDLWKGFSKEIVLKIGTVEEVPEEEYGPFFWFPHQIQDIYYQPEDERIHLARSLSHRLLVIKDVNGQIVPFDHTADNDSWDTGVWEDESPWDFFGRKTSSYLTHPTASLLRQFRKKLQPGMVYSLQMGAKSTRMSWSEEDWTSEDPVSCLQRVEGPQQDILCDQTSFQFQVLAGIKVPRFCISMSTTSSIYSLSSGTTFEIHLEVTSLAKVPIMLDFDYQGRDGWRIGTTLAHQGKDGIDVFFLDPLGTQDYKAVVPADCWLSSNRNGWLWNDLELWLWDGIEPPSAEIIAGSYRQRIDDVRTTITPRRCFIPTLSSDVSVGPRLPWEAVIMCPGDRLRYKISVSNKGMMGFDKGGKFRLSLKDHYCDFWKEVSVTEVQSSDTGAYGPISWPDCGPIHLEIVSAVALTLECIFEREKPQPFHRLPRELREQIYEYLRYKERAKYTDFMVKP